MQAFLFDNFSLIYQTVQETVHCATGPHTTQSGTLCLKIFRVMDGGDLGTICANCAPSVILAATRVLEPRFWFFFQ